MFFAMMRPAEVTSLTKDGCHLPETGWGRLIFSDSSPAAGREFTDDGQVHDDRGLKGRDRQGHARTAPLMEAALRWLAEATPGSAEMLRLMDATPVPCGQSAVTAKRSDLYGWAGYGYCPSHSRWYWGARLLLICTCDGTVTGFGLANPKLFGEREQARQMLTDQPASRPAPGTAVVTGKGLSGQETEAFFASDDLGLTLIRPARKDEKAPRYFPNWLRQRVEAKIWTLKNQLGLERHGGRVPAGLWARIVQRLLALNACIWHNWMIGAPVKRSLIAYDH